MRGSGILLPISSLPSKYGIGSFSKEAFEFVDRLNKAGQKYWQILPIGPTGFGDSPYQALSTFAGNPYFIDLDQLVEEGYLLQEEVESLDVGDDERNVDYGKVYNTRNEILEKAFARFKEHIEDEFYQFEEENSYWLQDYAFYMAVKKAHNGASYVTWEEDIRLRKSETVVHYEKVLEENILCYKFQQYMFFKQWHKLKDYANRKGIKIIGDIPFYVATDSADCFSQPSLFQYDEKNTPTHVAGCPPDAFSENGQLWGNPLYDWEYLKNTDYEWWINRIRHSLIMYDIIRLDHFRGFEEYYAIPAGSSTAKVGAWKRGPGIEFFKTIKRVLGDVSIIAEDLGFLNEAVYSLVRESGFPGMKVLQFAFDSREDSDYLPHNYDKNCVVYTGTHDNNTVLGWYQEISSTDQEFLKDYMNLQEDNMRELNWNIIRLALSSVADTCIIPIQDYLGLGSETRINRPGSQGANWKWRMRKNEFSDELVKKINHLVTLYGRK
ncbi:MAG: 4-alpha-glucanotransferase [bacterium]|nr:4-alpha-glucanotransferase [bacterium]